jgi:hypothetical protein
MLYPPAIGTKITVPDTGSGTYMYYLFFWKKKFDIINKPHNF